jgi:hypothetical protein
MLAGDANQPPKRPSAGGRLARLLASLRQPARAGGRLPVQTGFPTSLADLVLKNHGRLKNPQLRHRPSAAAPPSPAPPVAPHPPPAQEQTREVALTVRNAPDVRAKGAPAFTIRPEVLAVGGAVALALLVVWSEWLVLAATVASVALFGVESVRSSSASGRRPRPETTEGRVSPIREEATRSSCAESDKGSEVVSCRWEADASAPARKEKRRSSLRKLIAKKLRNGKRPSMDTDADDTCSVRGGERKHPEHAGEAGVNAVVPFKTEAPCPAPAVDATPLGAFPSAALVPVVLVGLVAGKLPAVALTVLCAVFFSSVDRS